MTTIAAAALAASEGHSVARRPKAPAGAAVLANGPARPNTATAAGPAAAPAVANPVRPAAPKPRPRLSPKTAGRIFSSAPAWKAPPPAPAEKTPPAPDDPDVVKLPPVIVNSQRLPRTDEKEWLTPRARDEALVKEYLSDFDRVLNHYTLPLVGVAKEARARMMHAEDKRLQDLRWINDRIEQTQLADPEAAKELTQIRDRIFVREAP